MKTTIKTIAVATVLSLAAIAAKAATSVSLAEATPTYIFMKESGRVDANDTDIWTLTLYAGVKYCIKVDGDGATDLRVSLFDDNENEIDNDDYTENGAIEVTPKWSGKFFLKIHNCGNVYNRYEIEMRRK